jgi:hypothetical protein
MSERIADPRPDRGVWASGNRGQPAAGAAAGRILPDGMTARPSPDSTTAWLAMKQTGGVRWACPASSGWADAVRAGLAEIDDALEWVA